MRIPAPARLAAAFVVLSPALFAQTGEEELSPRPDLDAQLESWQEAHGDTWRAFPDWETGHLQMLAGGNVEALRTLASDSDEAWAELALEYVTLVEPMFGVEAGTLRFDRTVLLPFGQYGSTDKMTVRFEQEYAGLPVVGGSTNVLMDRGGRLLSVQSIAAPRLVGLTTTPTITPEFAADITAADFATRARLDADTIGQPELVIYQQREAGLRKPVLAWQVDASLTIDGAQPVAYTYWVDAQTGAVVDSEDRIHNFDVGGNVQSMATPGEAPDTGTNPETPQTAKRLRVTSSAGTTFTDDNGDFNYPGATGPLDCTFTYVGTFADVANSSGGAYSLNQSLTGTGNMVTMNPAPNDLTTAQSNAFVQINALRDWVRSVIPGDATADFQADANCNINSSCNAFYNGSSVNFYTAGSGCPNTSYSSVIVHEMGHWLNVRYGTGNGSSGIGEGNADHFATYMYDTPSVGVGFSGPGTTLRTGNNTRQFCGDCCVGCYGGVHTDGQVWMGATWKVRTRLKSTHGSGLGGDIANLLFLGWLNGYDQTTITSIMEIQWLTLDDDDGNIGNGTPNYLDIDGGYRQQGFPGHDLDNILITGVTDLPNTPIEAGPYMVEANIFAQINPPLQSASLRWRVGGGAFNIEPMVPVGGDDYIAAIPDVPSPAVVEYYIEGRGRVRHR